MNEEQITIRTSNPDDFSFIMDSWLHSYYDSSSFTRGIPKPLFFKFHHEIAKRILERPTTTSLMAVMKTDPDVIFGYGIFEKQPEFKIIHYLYVKRAFGQQGIASQILKEAPFDIDEYTFASHSTPRGKSIAFKHGITYLPYLL